MAASTATVARRLPRGWAHLALQFAFWIAFYFAYQLARGVADREGEATAFANGAWVIDFQRSLGSMIELTLQRAVESSTILIQATSLTYWLSQFAVVGIALIWVYFKAHDRFYGFRNMLIVGNLIGLLGYVLLPTAPPRMFPEAGFTDTLAAHSTVNHSSTFVAFASNPYAAMPSLHALDATIVSVVMATVVRRRWAKVLWLAWAPWVWFAVMATGNHFWLDVAAGVLVAGARRGDRVPPVAVPAHDRRMSLKEAYTGGARAIASRSMTGLARTRVTPNMLTAAGVTLCAVGAVLVYFEYRTEWMFFFGGLAFVVGSILDILDGALARAGGKQTPFGGFLDSTLDRVGEGLMLGAIALVFMRDGQGARARACDRGDRRLLPRPVRAREGGGARDQGRRRDRVAGGARDRDRGRARARSVGRAPVGDRPARADRLDHGAAADPARPPRARAPR